MTTHLSVVIATLNSAQNIERTLAAVQAAVSETGMTTEIIVVDDGSVDETWQILLKLTQLFEAPVELKAIRLQKNVGQHASLLCGLRASSGRYIVTLDDDLQNDPAEIPAALVHLIASGMDAVIISYETFEKSFVRILGSRIIQFMIKSVFRPPPGITSSPFRIMKQSVVNQISATSKSRPFITGELFLATSLIANFSGIHKKRISGSSNYKLRQLLTLCSTIFFSYSLKPVFASIKASFVLALSLFFWGTYVVINQMGRGETVPGYASTMIIISIIGASILLVLGLVLKSLTIALMDLQKPSQFNIAERTF
jgi:glycosyltransferase involved in cell wall biosynthesis